ncbi:MAG: T9SS type A sorting domain-containing protein [Bacteroidales bacterium]|nr:T9SS type A sorting domain-containing protein [Bacteroidales bacterium]
MKRLSVLITFVVLPLFLFAQNLISSGGGVADNNNIKASFSIGEPIIETFSKNNMHLTQGFHQSVISVTAIEINEYKDFNINVFPNPANSFVNVNIKSENFQAFKYQLFDTNGKLLQNQTFDKQNIQIDVQNFPKGIYFLKVYHQKEHYSTHKLIIE